jgi:hypothetical protein
MVRSGGRPIAAIKIIEIIINLNSAQINIFQHLFLSVSFVLRNPHVVDFIKIIQI